MRKHGIFKFSIPKGGSESKKVAAIFRWIVNHKLFILHNGDRIIRESSNFIKVNGIESFNTIYTNKIVNGLLMKPGEVRR